MGNCYTELQEELKLLREDNKKQFEEIKNLLLSMSTIIILTENFDYLELGHPETQLTGILAV